MATIQALTKVSFAALLGYALAVVGLIQAHLSSLPEGAARTALLRALIDAFQKAEADWTEKSRVQREALNNRDFLFGEGLKLYTPPRNWAQTLARGKRKHREHMRDLVAQCPAPSDLSPADAFLPFSTLAAGIAAHPGVFTSVKMDDAKTAELRGYGEALLAAVDTLAAADRERGEASAQCDLARAELIEELQETLGYLKALLPPAGIAGLENIRTRFLRATPEAKEATPAPVVEEKKEEEDEEKKEADPSKPTG